jgi:hypothetical protein
MAMLKKENYIHQEAALRSKRQRNIARAFCKNMRA